MSCLIFNVTRSGVVNWLSSNHLLSKVLWIIIAALGLVFPFFL